MILIPNEPYLIEVDVGGQINLSHAAKLAGMSVSELRTLNSGFKRAATDPQGPHKLLVPVNKAEIFQERLACLLKRWGMRRHKVHKSKARARISRLDTPSIVTRLGPVN